MGQSDQTTDVIQPDDAKDPVLILVLALILGAIAYFVIGQWQKGIAGLLVWLCMGVFAVLTCGIGAIFFPVVAAVIIIDAYMQAKLLKDGKPIRQWTFFGTGA